MDVHSINFDLDVGKASIEYFGSIALTETVYGTKVPIFMLNSESTHLFLTECMMRGMAFNITLLEPNEHAFESMCYFLHTSNEYPDYDDDGYVWIRRT